jgi:hypothetical protein
MSPQSQDGQKIEKRTFRHCGEKKKNKKKPTKGKYSTIIFLHHTFFLMPYPVQEKHGKTNDFHFHKKHREEHSEREKNLNKYPSIHPILIRKHLGTKNTTVFHSAAQETKRGHERTRKWKRKT